MLKPTIVLIPFLLAGTAVWAAPVEFQVTLDTSSIAGTSGSLDFALYPGAGSDQYLAAAVFGFSTDTGLYGGGETLTGNAFGGPVTQDDTLLLVANTASQDNDDLETFLFGDTLTFLVGINGPALTAPDGLATSPYEFVFSTYSDAAGTIPVLTGDPGGAAGVVTISAEGVVGTSAVSPDLTFVSTPEPGTLWTLAGAMLFLGALLYVRRCSPSPRRR